MMKQNILISLRLTVVMLVLCCGFYFGIITLIGKFSFDHGGGEKVRVNGKVVGYANVGQKFTEEKYFWGRPSAVDYNAAGSGGSNKASSNPEYVKTVNDRIDSFLLHNPGVTKEQIPADLVTASGSGLDPDISPEAAMVQVRRIASVRNISAEKITALVTKHIENSFLGPSKINVLKLNVSLDELKNNK